VNKDIHTRGLIVDRTRITHSDISPTLSLNFTGGGNIVLSVFVFCRNSYSLINL